MGEPKHHDGELEQELDDLYRKAAGLEPSDGGQDPERPKQGRTLSPPARTGLPRRQRPVRARRRRLRFTSAAWALGVVLLAGGALVLLYPLVGYRQGALNVGGIDYPSKTHRLTGETSYFSGQQWLRAPAPGKLLQDGSGPKDRPSGVPALATPPKVAGELFAVQVRAYPEDQKANAVVFLEELRLTQPAAFLETVRIAGRGVWHRVLVGRFATAQEAADYRQSHGLASEHPYSFTQKISPDRP